MPTTGPDPKRIDVGERQRISCQLKKLNDILGRLGQLVKNTAGLAHALSCGVLDRHSNEATCLGEALNMIDDFQRRTYRWESASQETTEIFSGGKAAVRCVWGSPSETRRAAAALELIVRHSKKEIDWMNGRVSCYI